MQTIEGLRSGLSHPAARRWGCENTLRDFDVPFQSEEQLRQTDATSSRQPERRKYYTCPSKCSSAIGRPSQADGLSAK